MIPPRMTIDLDDAYVLEWAEQLHSVAESARAQVRAQVKDVMALGAIVAGEKP